MAARTREDRIAVLELKIKKKKEELATLETRFPIFDAPVKST